MSRSGPGIVGFTAVAQRRARSACGEVVFARSDGQLDQHGRELACHGLAAPGVHLAEIGRPPCRKEKWQQLLVASAQRPDAAVSLE